MATDDPREELGRGFSRFLHELFGDDDAWKTLLTPLRSIQCQHCHKPNQLQVLDVNALDKLLTQFFGKPVETVRHDVHVLTGTFVPAELTDSQLQAIESGQTVVEGQWEELGPPELPPAA